MIREGSKTGFSKWVFDFKGSNIDRFSRFWTIQGRFWNPWDMLNLEFEKYTWKYRYFDEKNGVFDKKNYLYIDYLGVRLG